MKFSSDEFDRITNFVDAVRSLMEQNPRAFEPRKQFPLGASAQASHFLGQRIVQFLPSIPVHCVDAIRTSEGVIQNHTWLSVGDIVIDVTHDQFENTGLAPGQWVFEQSTDWHLSFQESAPAQLLGLAQWPAKLRTLYARTLGFCL